MSGKQLSTLACLAAGAYGHHVLQFYNYDWQIVVVFLAAGLSGVMVGHFG